MTRPSFPRAFPWRLLAWSTAGAPTPKRKLTSAGRAATSPVMGGIYRALLFALAMLAALPAVRAEPARLPILHLLAGSDAGTVTPYVRYSQPPGRSEERRVGKECVRTVRSRWAA